MLVVVDDDDGLQKSEGHCGRSSSLQYRLRLVARFILFVCLAMPCLSQLARGVAEEKASTVFLADDLAC
jgi:hypothetical protein